MESPEAAAAGLGLAAAVLMCVAIAFLANVMYSYSAGYWALFAAFLLAAAAVEVRRKAPKVNKVRGAMLAIGALFSVCAAVAALVHASQPNTRGMDVNRVPAFAVFSALGCALMSYLSLSSYARPSPEAPNITIKDDLDLNTQDEPEWSGRQKCVTCCGTTLWTVLVALIVSSSVNVMLLTHETIDLAEISEGSLYQIGDHKVFARCMGEGEPTVFFSHGLGGNSLDFTHVQRNISAYTRTCSYDRAGYGRSQVRGPQRRLTDQISDEEVLLLDALEIEEAVFVGHSFAGFNLRGTESKAPEKFLGMVLVDAVNPNATLGCVEDVKTTTPLYQFGMFVQPLGGMRVMELFGILDVLSGTQPLPQDVQQQYKRNLYKNEYFRTRNDEFDYWGTSCSFIDQLEGEEKLLNFPVTHILPVNGIYKDILEYATELPALSVDGKTTIMEDTTIDHVSILFDIKFATSVIEEVFEMIEKVSNVTILP